MNFSFFLQLRRKIHSKLLQKIGNALSICLKDVSFKNCFLGVRFRALNDIGCAEQNEKNKKQIKHEIRLTITFFMLQNKGR